MPRCQLSRRGRKKGAQKLQHCIAALNSLAHIIFSVFDDGQRKQENCAQFGLSIQRTLYLAFYDNNLVSQFYVRTDLNTNERRITVTLL